MARGAASPPWDRLVLPLRAYLLSRAGSGAFTPASAPSFYRYSLETSVILGNLVSYPDRTVTFTAAVLLLLALVGRPAVMSLQKGDRRTITFGVW